MAPPDGPILAVRVDDLIEKEAVLAANPKAFFTIPHFDGYPAVLIQLRKVSTRALKDAITDGWLACARSCPVKWWSLPTTVVLHHAIAASSSLGVSPPSTASTRAIDPTLK